MFNKGTSPLLVTLTWALLWLSMIVSFCIYLPGFAEFDTGKYLTISHTMLDQHQYLLAYWQGQPYSDKPPLLFWLILLGWKVFGVSNWWPQFLVLSLATASLIVTQQLARLLWPENRRVAAFTPFILIGCFNWVWLTKLIRVDSLLVLATLLCVYFAYKTLTGSKKNWLGYLLAVGLGGFAKGPIILVFILIPILFLPALQQQHKRPFTPVWFGWFAFTTLLGLALPLLWAIPAAIQGGTAFTQEIFYRQITHRVQMHEFSNWYYLLRLPLWLLPWTIYPPVWHGSVKMLKAWRSTGISLCFLLITVGLLAFSLFGQKLPHYLYPLFPFFALLIAFCCSQTKSVKPSYQWPVAAVTLAFGLYCVSFPLIFPWLSHNSAVRTYFLQEMNLTLWGSLFMLIGLALFLIQFKSQLQQVIALAITTAILSLFINGPVLQHYQTHLSNQAVLQALKNNPLIAVENSGKITDSEILALLTHAKIPQNDLASWGNQHPKGLILSADYTPQTPAPKLWFYQSRFSIIALEDFSRRTK